MLGLCHAIALEFALAAAGERGGEEPAPESKRDEAPRAPAAEGNRRK